MAGEIEVSICLEEEWQNARECLARAFHHYPLYSHLIPNDSKRKSFLSRYLDAIYEVTVQRGNSVLICVKLKTEADASSVTNKKIIGAVLLVPPSLNGGWECAKDGEFWEAYDKYKLKEIDGESFKRLKHYEEWEYESITERICNSGVPMWNGILCGIDPDHASKGWGNMSYNKCLTLIENLHNERMGPTTSHSRLPFDDVVERLSSLFEVDSTYGSHRMSGLFIKILHSLSMLSRRAPIMHDLATEHKIKLLASVADENCKPLSPAPILFALGHSTQSSQFHRQNGFCPIVERPYNTFGLNNEATFIVQAMVMRLCDSQPKSLPARIIPCFTKHLNDPKNAELPPPSECLPEEGSMDNYIVSTV